MESDTKEVRPRMPTRMKRLRQLQPVLEALLSTENSRACALLISHLEDRLLNLLAQCLNAILVPRNKRILQLQREDREPIRHALQPYKYEVLSLSDRGVGPIKRRQRLDHILRKHPDFHTVLAGIAKTLFHLIESKLKKN